ncbi:MAG TPA: hypothetical protein VGY55_11800 [Pirellulales bacterium]|jgi:hypothetical protein|nr:hypothetical protein [Pirellulales bacterium]
MSRFRFEVATAEDDAELRRVLAATPMPGHVSVSYRREPSYFAAAAVSGGFHQVLVVRDAEAGRIAAFISRSVRSMRVNGQPEPIGYLSALRALPQYRSGGLLARGTAYLRHLHSDGRAKLYLATIAEGNDKAISVLTSGRSVLPAFHPAGQYFGLAVPISRRRRRVSFSAGETTLAEARPEDLPELLDFLRIWGPRRQFFPEYGPHDFFHDEATFKDLQPSDVLLARRNGRLVGTIGGWDQHGFKQSIVEGYGAALQWVSPVYNLWASVRARPGLPRPGSELRYLTAAIPVVADDDPEVFLALARAVLARAAGGEHQYLMLGLHERDPFLPAARRLGGRTYAGRLYLACWNDGEELRERVDDRPPYMELGCM